jgi:cytochrome c
VSTTLKARTQARLRPRVVPALALIVAACGNNEVPSDVQTGQNLDAAAAPAGPDLARGELLSFACQACHALTPAGGADIGPSLYGVFGRAAASVPEFEYSAALRSADFQWTPERLDAWLQAPTQYLPGTTMAFAGYRDPEDRAALIAWLVSATAAP